MITGDKNMEHRETMKNLSRRLLEDGQTFRWFWERFIPEMKYTTLIVQKNGISPPDPRFLEAIQKYLAT
jgi:hypothetical protein